MSQQDVNGSACALTIDDIDTTVNGEPRIHDLRLARALGFKRPRTIRDLIERYLETLERLGGICRTVRQNPGRGRPATEYWMAKKQAAFLTTKSETEPAIKVTIAVIEVFDAATSGRALPPPEPSASLPPPAPPEEPPFCKGCWARDWWTAPKEISKAGHPLADGPLEPAELDIIRIFRNRVKFTTEERLKARAGAVLAALGLPAPQPAAQQPAPPRVRRRTP